MTAAYAQRTTVDVSKTRSEIDRLLVKYGATQVGIMNDELEACAAVLFTMRGARFRIAIPLPTDKELAASRRQVSLEQLRRERWRAVLLLLKSKLEIVRLGVVTLEHEFMADLLLPNGGTVGEQLAEAIRHGLGTSAGFSRTHLLGKGTP